MTDGWGISCKIALRWMPLDLTNDKSTLVQVMAWCRQATSHYLSQCWPRFMSPYGVTRPQWVNLPYVVGLVQDCSNSIANTPSYCSLALSYQCVSWSETMYAYWQGACQMVRLPWCQWSNPEGYGPNWPVPQHNKTQWSINWVHISWAVLFKNGWTHIIYMLVLCWDGWGTFQ